MCSNFERLHEIINEAYAENFSILSQKWANPPYIWLFISYQGSPLEKLEIEHKSTKIIKKSFIFGRKFGFRGPFYDVKGYPILLVTKFLPLIFGFDQLPNQSESIVHFWVSVQVLDLNQKGVLVVHNLRLSPDVGRSKYLEDISNKFGLKFFFMYYILPSQIFRPYIVSASYPTITKNCKTFFISSQAERSKLAVFLFIMNIFTCPRSFQCRNNSLSLWPEFPDFVQK